MFAIKVRPPYEKEHFGGEVGIVDWGRDGENVIEFNDDSNTARSISLRPDLYRIVILPAPPEVEEIVESAPETVDEPPVSIDPNISWKELRTEAKLLGISTWHQTKDELLKLVIEAMAEKRE